MTRLRLGHPAAVFAVALVVRLLHVWQVAPTPFFELHRRFAESDMYMFDQWAGSIASGDWLSRSTPHPLYEWQLALAPEAKWREWYGPAQAFYKAPAYPYLLAALRTFWGDPMLPAALLQCLASGLAAALLVRLGDRSFGAPAGLWAGMLFALYAPAVHYDAVLLRGPWIVLSALLATLSFGRLWEHPTPRRAGIVGLWVAASLLVNEGFAPAPLAVLAVLPFRVKSLRPLATAAGALAAGIALGLAPLIARNLAVGAPPLGLAVTGSIVHAVFNAPGANPWAFEIRPQVLAPLMDKAGGGALGMALACLAGFPSLASLVAFYLQKLAGLLIPFENPDNANFYYAALLDPMLTALPAYGTLLALAAAGLLAARSRLGTLVPLVPFAATSLVAILMTTTLSRYRVVFAAFLFPLAGFALAEMVACARGNRKRLAILLACSLAAAGLATLLEGRLEGAARVSASRYRPPEFYLAAEAWAERGLPGRAVAEMLSLVRHNPDPRTQAWALVRAASLLLENGDVAQARESLDLATRIGRRDAALLMAAGDLWRERPGEAAAARGLYERALGLSPPAALESQLRQRLLEGPQAVK